MESSDKAAIDQEQRFHEIERRVLEQQQQQSGLQEENHKLKVANVELTEHKDRADARVAELERSLADRDERVTKAEAIAADTRGTAEVSNESLQALRTTSKRLEEDLKDANDRVAARSEELTTVQTELDKINAQQMPVQLAYEKCLQQVALLKEQNQGYTDQLQERTDSLTAVRAESLATKSSLQATAETAAKQASTFKEQLVAANERLQAQTGELQSTLEQLRDERTERAQHEAIQKRAMEAQAQMATMSQAATSEREKTIEQMHSAINEANQQRDEAAGKLDQIEQQGKQAVEQLKKDYESEVAELKAVMANIRPSDAVVAVSTQKELVVGGDAASSFMPDGNSMSELYSQLADTKSFLLVERQEKAGLEQSLEFILKEVESKAPIIEQQKLDFDNLVRSHAQLATRLEQNATDKAVHRAEVAQLKSQIEELEGFNQVLEKQAAGMAEQLHNWISKQQAHHHVDVAIELQQSNTKLQEQVCQLQQQLKTQKDQSQQQADKTLSNKLNEAFSMGATLKNNMESMRAETSRIVGQRDLYKVLLQHAEAGKAAGAIEGAGGGGGVTTALDESVAVAALQTELQQIKESRSIAQGKLQDELDKARNECSEVKIELTKSSSQAEFREQRHLLLLKNTEAMRTELQALRDKNIEHTSILISQQNEVAKALQLVDEQRLKTNEATHQLHQMTAQKMRAERNETALESRIATISQDKARQTRLLTNLEGIFQDFEKSSTLHKKHSAAELEANQREVLSLKSSLEKFGISSKETEDKLTHKLSEARSGLEAAEKKLLAATTARDRLTEQLTERQEQFSAAEKELSAAEVKLLVFAGSDNTGETDTAIQMASLKSDLTALQQTLSLKEETVQQFKNIATANEQALAKAQSDHTAVMLKASTEADEVKVTVSKLETSAGDLGRELALKQQECEKLKLELKEQVDSFDAEIAMLQATDTALKQQTKQCEEEAETARQAMQAAEARRDQVEGKYEREVNNHATKIKEAAALQSIVDKSKREAHLAREALGAIETKMREEKVSASTEALGKKKAAGEIAARLKQLESHNELLHAQLDLRLDSLQSTSQQDKGGQDSSAIQEVLRFVRKEKEVAVARLELAEQEGSRWRHKADLLQNQMEDCQKQLQQEMDRNESQRRTQGELKLLMQHVSELNELREKNSTLASKVQRLESEKASAANQQQQQVAAQLDKAVKASESKTLAAEAKSKAMIEETEKWKDRLKAKIRELKTATDTSQTEIAGLNQKVKESVKATAQVQTLLDVAIEEKKKLGESFEAKVKELAAVTDKKAKAMGALTKMKRSIDELKSTNKTLTEELEQTKAQSTSGEGSAELQLKVQLLQGQLSNEQEAKSQLEQLKKMHARLTQQYEQVKSKLKEAVASCQSGVELGEVLAKLNGEVQSNPATAPVPTAAKTAVEQAPPPTPPTGKDPFLKDLKVTSQSVNPQIDAPKQLPVPVIATSFESPAAAKRPGEQADAPAGKRLRTTEEGAAAESPANISTPTQMATARAAAIAAKAKAVAAKQAAAAKAAAVAKPGGGGTPAAKAKAAGSGTPVTPAAKAAAAAGEGTPGTPAAGKGTPVTAAAKAAAAKAAAAKVAAAKAAAAKVAAAKAAAAKVASKGTPVTPAAKTAAAKTAGTPGTAAAKTAAAKTAAAKLAAAKAGGKGTPGTPAARAAAKAAGKGTPGTPAAGQGTAGTAATPVTPATAAGAKAIGSKSATPTASPALTPRGGKGTPASGAKAAVTAKTAATAKAKAAAGPKGAGGKGTAAPPATATPSAEEAAKTAAAAKAKTAALNAKAAMKTKQLLKAKQEQEAAAAKTLNPEATAFVLPTAGAAATNKTTSATTPTRGAKGKGRGRGRGGTKGGAGKGRGGVKRKDGGAGGAGGAAKKPNSGA